MTNKKILIAEISGKRPGDKKKRPTEKFKYDFDKVIISNNSKGYDTDWRIINVPQDYQDWYKKHCKMSDLAYFAPMNRSYAIKYAREHGYDYLIQLDDNIEKFSIRYLVRQGKDVITYDTLKNTPHKEGIPDAMFNYMADVLDNTNVGMIGMVPDSGAVPQDDWLKERYVYSAFMLNLNRVPSYFQGDFEDDIEYRLKLKQIDVPSLEVVPFHYSKTSQDKHNGTEDSTGNREAYIKAGLKRGEHMSKLYGDYYQRGISTRGSGIKRTGVVKFRHKVKQFKVGVYIKHQEILKNELMDLFKKFATPKADKIETAIEKPKYKVQVVTKNQKDIPQVLLSLAEIGFKYQVSFHASKEFKIQGGCYLMVSEDSHVPDAIKKKLSKFIDRKAVKIS